MTFATPAEAFRDDDPRPGAILRIARAQFMAKGYAATRMEPIAREAAVSTATLYGYFPSKAALFAAVIDDCAQDFADRIESVRAAARGDAVQRLTALAEAYADFMSDPFVRAVFRLVMAERPRFEDAALRFFEGGRDGFGAPLIDTIRALVAAGELRAERPAWAAGQLMGMIEHTTFVAPILTGESAVPARPPAAIAADAVETFMARYRA